MYFARPEELMELLRFFSLVREDLPLEVWVKILRFDLLDHEGNGGGNIPNLASEVSTCVLDSKFSSVVGSRGSRPTKRVQMPLWFLSHPVVLEVAYKV